MDWPVAAVAVGSALVGALAGGVASYRIQETSRIRRGRTQLYLAFLLPFHREVRSRRESRKVEPQATDEARRLCRELLREAITVGKQDANQVQPFAAQLENLRVRYDSFVV